MHSDNTSFHQWLKTHDLSAYDFSGVAFPPAADRAFWDEKYDPAVVSEGEACLQYAWPVIKATAYMDFVQTGTRLSQEKPHMERRRVVKLLLLAEVLEHKGRFLPDLVDGLFLIAEETYWGISAHIIRGDKTIPNINERFIDLFSAETAELLTFAYYMLHKELSDYCPQILTRIEQEITRRIVDIYLEDKNMWWMGYTGALNNWNPWILSNLLTVFLHIPMPREKQLAGIAKTMTEVGFYHSVVLADGGCDEGAVYWSVASGKMFEYCLILSQATYGKINFMEEERLRESFFFPEKAYIGNGYVTSYCDCSSKITGVENLLYQIGLFLNRENCCRLAKELRDNAPAERTVRSGSVRRQFAGLVYKSEIDKQPPYTPEKQYVLPVLQTACIREDKWYYSARGYNNYHSHSHNDVGNFIAYYDNAPVLLDVGCGVYTKQTFSPKRYDIWTMQSDWHNLPKINGISQTNSDTAICDKFCVTDNCTTLSFPAAYPQEAGVKCLVRNVDLQDGVTVEDTFCFEGNQNQVLEHFITPLPVRIEGETAYLGEQFMLTANCASEISVTEMPFGEDNKLINSWNTDKVTRIGFSFATGKDFTVKFTLRRL